jgi:hypothetical protein
LDGIETNLQAHQQRNPGVPLDPVGRAEDNQSHRDREPEDPEKGIGHREKHAAVGLARSIHPVGVHLGKGRLRQVANNPHLIKADNLHTENRDEAREHQASPAPHEEPGLGPQGFA